MKKENAEQATILIESIDDHEDFISQCDYVLRNKGKNDAVYVDQWFTRGMASGAITHEDFLKLVLDLRDIATVRMADLDKKLEAM